MEAETLLAWCLGWDRAKLWNHTHENFSSLEQDEYEKCISRRESREPLQLILGTWDFMGLALQQKKGVFIPRPETEVIAQRALEILRTFDEIKNDKSQLRILDLGVGSGTLLVSLLALGPSQTRGFGIEKSFEACTLAHENVRLLGLEGRAQIIQGSWFEALSREGIFDLIVSNPPYLDTDLRHGIQPEVSWDPPQSLYAQDKGLADISEILATVGEHLVPGGWLVLETGSDLVPRVQALVDKQWSNTEIIRDESGISHGLALQRH